MEHDLISQIQSLTQSQYENKSEEFRSKTKEVLLNALNEIVSLENTILQKQSQLKGYEKEREEILIRLTRATDDCKRLREKLVELDIMKNMEILEMKFETNRGIEKLATEKEHLLDEKINVESQYNELTLNYTALKMETVELREQADRLGTELSQKKEEVEHLKNELSLLKENLNLKTEECLLLKTIMLEEKGENESLINSLKQELEDISSKMKTVIEEKNDLTTKLKGVEGERGTLLNKLNETERDSSTLRNERDTLETKVREIEQEKASLETRVGEAAKSDEEIKEYAVRLKDITEKFDHITKEKQEIFDELTNAQINIVSLEKEKTSLKDEMDRLIVEKTGLVTKLEAVELERESLKNEKNTIKDRLNDAEKNITTIKEEAEHLNTERGTLLNKLNEIERDSSTLRNERDTLETKVREIEQEKASLETRPEEIAGADREQEALLQRLRDIAVEARMIMKEKDNEVALLKSALDAAHLRILEMLARF